VPAKVSRVNSQRGVPDDGRSPNYRQPPIRPRIHRAPQPFDGERDAKKLVGMAHPTCAVLRKTKPISEKPKRVYISLLQKIMKINLAEGSKKQSQTKPILRLGSTSLTTGRSEPALSPFGYAQGKLCRRDRSSDYPCVFELAAYNLVLRDGNIRDFDGEYVKWQMHQRQMQ